MSRYCIYTHVEHTKATENVEWRIVGDRRNGLKLELVDRSLLILARFELPIPVGDLEYYSILPFPIFAMGAPVPITQ